MSSDGNTVMIVAAAAKEQPNEFEMVIQGGMLDALGINMYSTLAKSMVEFVANAYDGEASYVNIAIPFDRILAARATVREVAKQAVQAGTMDPFTVLLLPLPDDIQIIISDDGHGMDPDDVRNKFLPVNRKRRLDAAGKEKNLNSETGRRKVMGRKGLGKLAGFGVAEKVTIKTKREGDEFWTVFDLDYNVLSHAPNLGGVKIPATYPAGNKADKGTVITLSRLRCDALKRGEGDLVQTLNQNFFGVRPEDFSIQINAKRLEAPIVEYDFVFPEDRPHGGFARVEVEVLDVGEVVFDYVVQFRKPGQSLKNDQRGARIYCHNRLAAGPSLFGLPSGVHNFHGQDYMECIIQADQLDELGIDLVSTDRTQLKGESEVVVALLDRITNIFRQALNAHYKHKEGVVDREIAEKKPQWLDVVESMDKKTREPARKLLRTLGSQFGVGSQEFENIAPLVMNTMNAGEVLIRLIEIGTSATDLPHITRALRDLAEVEKSQALTIFRGRRSAILALRNLIKRGHDEWRKTQFEVELQNLLKANPWLIRQEFSRHLTSDETLGKVCTDLAQQMSVDRYAPADDVKNPDLRPDLVFLMNDPGMYEVVIVELKSPSIPLEDKHLLQLQGYISDVEGWLQRKFSHTIKVTGYLIGTREKPEKRTRGASTLENIIAKAGPSTEWKVYDLHELLRNTEAAHAEIINALEKDLGDDHVLAPKDSTVTSGTELQVATDSSNMQLPNLPPTTTVDPTRTPQAWIATVAPSGHDVLSLELPAAILGLPAPTDSPKKA